MNEENNTYEPEKSFNSAPEQFEARIRKNFPISSKVIEFIVLQNSKNGYNNNLSNDKLVELLFMTLKRMYSVTAFIPRTKLNSVASHRSTSSLKKWLGRDIDIIYFINKIY